MKQIFPLLKIRIRMQEAEQIFFYTEYTPHIPVLCWTKIKVSNWFRFSLPGVGCEMPVCSVCKLMLETRVKISFHPIPEMSRRNPAERVEPVLACLINKIRVHNFCIFSCKAVEKNWPKTPTTHDINKNVLFYYTDWSVCELSRLPYPPQREI